jgi:putative transposase
MLGLMRAAGKANSLNKDFQLWQQNNHPIPLTTMKIAHRKIDFMHNNPLEAAFVDVPEEYVYSSARDYSGMK